MGRLGRGNGKCYRETVAFLWTHKLSDSIAEEAGARATAEALGYKLDVIKPWKDGLSENDVNRILWARGIRGVLLAPNYSSEKPGYHLEWNKFAGVLLGSSLVNTGLPRVSRDYFHDAKSAMEHLHQAGFRRVAMVLDASIHERTDRRYAAAFLTRGGSLSRLHIVKSNTTDVQERTRLLAWKKKANADFFLFDCSRFEAWFGTRVSCAKLFLKAGECGPGIRPDFHRIGAEAMRLLSGLLQENRVGLVGAPVSILIPGAWEPSTRSLQKTLRAGSREVG
jgi:hypothetical protein